MSTRRTTLGDAKDSTISDIASVLNVATTDARFIRYINQAQQRLLETGEQFWGSHARYLFCLSEDCITWPREIANIEAAAVCDTPIPIRNGWFEFMGNGYGIQGTTDGDGCGNSCGGLQLYDRGVACAFNDIIGTNKKIRVYADVAESATSKITLQGYDENGNWIRTEVSGSWIDGEQVLISTTPQLSTKKFSSLVSVLKPATNGPVRLYEYNTDTAAQRALAIYAPDEKRPSYRRSAIVGLSTCEGACETARVTVSARLEFIPARTDNDWLLIGNLGALRLACQAIRKEGADLWDDAVRYWGLARQALRDELAHRVGSGTVQPINVQDAAIFGASGCNVI